MRKVKRKNTVEIWQSEVDGKWYWHVLAPNGKFVSDGAEGYASKSNAKRGFITFWQTPIEIEYKPRITN